MCPTYVSSNFELHLFLLISDRSPSHYYKYIVEQLKMLHVALNTEKHKLNILVHTELYPIILVH